MIIVFGSLNVDLVMPVGTFPKPGETVLCSTDYLSRTGGKGSNQAVAAARAGAKVGFVGKVGDDAFGRRSINNLKNNSIWASGIGISERPTGCATIAVDMTGANFIMVAPGANLDATSDQMPDEVFTPRNIILTQLEVTPAETFSVLQRARTHGAQTVLNASPAPQIPKEVLANVDYLIVNEIEAEQMNRHYGFPDAPPAIIAKHLSETGNGMTVIVTLEDRGSVAFHKGDTYAVDAYQIEVVDTTGAGDTFCGIFAAGLLAGKPFTAILHEASVGASLSCLGLGAQGHMPVAEDIAANMHHVEPPRVVK